MKDKLEITNQLSNELQTIVTTLVNDLTDTLDKLMWQLDASLIEYSNLNDDELEYYILNLTSVLYFVNSKLEILGIKEDASKLLRSKAYDKAKIDAIGTVAEKDAQASLASDEEQLVHIIHTRAYKQVKSKLEAGYEMIASLKKVLNRRLAELELSNSRFIKKEE